MFDIAPTELLAVAVVALLVIGPKDLPKAMRVVGQWVARAKGVARQFRSGFDTMVREAELVEMEKKWAEENKRIMDEHSGGATVPSDPVPTAADQVDPETASEPDLFSQPVLVEKPVVIAGPLDAIHPTETKASS